jgi:hypothetical protein
MPSLNATPIVPLHSSSSIRITHLSTSNFIELQRPSSSFVSKSPLKVGSPLLQSLPRLGTRSQTQLALSLRNGQPWSPHPPKLLLSLQPTLPILSNLL